MSEIAVSFKKIVGNPVCETIYTHDTLTLVEGDCDFIYVKCRSYLLHTQLKTEISERLKTAVLTGKTAVFVKNANDNVVAPYKTYILIYRTGGVKIVSLAL